MLTILWCATGVPYDALDIGGKFAESFAQGGRVRHEECAEPTQVRVRILDRFGLLDSRTMRVKQQDAIAAFLPDNDDTSMARDRKYGKFNHRRRALAKAGRQRTDCKIDRSGANSAQMIRWHAAILELVVNKDQPHLIEHPLTPGLGKPSGTDRD